MEADNILEQINSAAIKLLVPLTVDEEYKIIVEEAIKLVQGEDGLIVREIDGELITVFGSSKSASAFRVRKRGNSYKSIKGHQAIIMHSKDIEEAYPKSGKRTIHSVIFLPLSYKEESEGVLILRSKEDKYFTSKEMNILKLFGSLASLAMKKNVLYEQTKQALDTRDMFIAIASHELRTPLTSLNGYVQLLHSRLVKKEDSVEAKWAQSLYEETARLTNLIKELLEVNRIKQGTLQFILRECYLSEVVEKSIERSKFSYKNREIILKNKIKKGKDAFIGDFEKMLQVITALLTNALKFSPPDIPVTITLIHQSDDLVLTITDKGKGMGREDIRRVFQGFYKSLENLQEGMGVGLMLAKHIIAYHKGSIEVTSAPKKGTTVEVILPRSSL